MYGHLTQHSDRLPSRGAPTVKDIKGHLSRLHCSQNTDFAAESEKRRILASAKAAQTAQAQSAREERREEPSQPAMRVVEALAVQSDRDEASSPIVMKRLASSISGLLIFSSVAPTALANDSFPAHDPWQDLDPSDLYSIEPTLDDRVLYCEAVDPQLSDPASIPDCIEEFHPDQPEASGSSSSESSELDLSGFDPSLRDFIVSQKSNRSASRKSKTSEPSIDEDQADDIILHEVTFPDNNFKSGDYHNFKLTNHTDRPIRVVLELNERDSGENQGHLELTILPHRVRELNFNYQFPECDVAHYVRTSAKFYVPKDATSTEATGAFFYIQRNNIYTTEEIDNYPSGFFACWESCCAPNLPNAMTIQGGPDYD